MIKIGITGQNGFIGTNLYNNLKFDNEVERIPFEKEYFTNQNLLQTFVKKCDVIVHLAGLNRHNDPNEIYETNIDLVNRLIDACETTDTKPHIVFTSSTQEEKDNAYGRSKKESRWKLEEWAIRNKAKFSGLLIPNVFGPFGDPHYNSFIATFCHQLTHNEQPRIEVDGTIKLIYIEEVIEKVKRIIFSMQGKESDEAIVEFVPFKHSAEKKVSEVLELLEGFKANYFKDGIFPNLNNPFERNLFNSFVSYIDHKGFFPFYLKQNTDDRGSFVETVKMNSGGQVSFSTTKPGITRGNHFHTRKAERFAVIKGKARIELRRIGTNEVLSFELDGEKPSFVDMPIWYTHNITNIGDQDLYTIFWISEFFNAEDPDTFFEEV
ncbi:MAG: NAD-dependent epimerase/dehydratase family protein [Bacteroidales bacterium]